jgi:hypothetical protein
MFGRLKGQKIRPTIQFHRYRGKLFGVLMARSGEHGALDA